MLTVIQDGETFRARDQRKENHFWADKEIVEDHMPHMGIYAFSVYMLLCYHSKHKTGRSWPSIPTLAKELGVSEPTIRKALEELATRKLIVVSEDKRLSKKGKAIPRPHVYTLLEVEKHKATPPGVGVVNPVDQGGKPHLPGVVNPVDPNNKNLKQEESKQDSIEDSLLSHPALPVTTIQISAAIPTPVPGQGKLTVLEVVSPSPIPPIAVAPLPAAAKGTRWIYPIQGDVAHLVKDSNLPERTLCGITPLPSYGGNPPTHPQTACPDCLHPKKAPRVRKPQPTDPLFDALGFHVLSAKTPADQDAVGWRISQIMNGDKRNKRTLGLIAYEKARQDKDDLDYAFLGKEVKTFWDAYQIAHPGYELKDCAKFMEQWVAWRSASAPAAPPEMVDDPERPGRKITAAQFRIWQAQQRYKEAHYGRK